MTSDITFFMSGLPASTRFLGYVIHDTRHDVFVAGPDDYRPHPGHALPFSTEAKALEYLVAFGRSEWEVMRLYDIDGLRAVEGLASVPPPGEDRSSRGPQPEGGTESGRD